MLQYKIPQDVEIEDKILGPLTLKQLVIVAIGGGISYGIFLILSKTYYLHIFDYLWICIPGLLSLAFAFLRINDVSFLKWIMLLFEFNHNSRRRRWNKDETARLHFAFVTAKTGETKKKEAPKKKPAAPGRKKFSSLEEITYVLDHSTNFAPEHQSAPDDHEAEYGLHLSAEEKARHEARIEKSIDQLSVPLPAVPKASIQPVAVALQSAVQKPTPTVEPAPKTITPTQPQRSNGQAVDMVHTSDTAAEHKISFTDLQRGGMISFS